MFLAEEIKRLKKERNAVILAHNYQVSEIQELADHVGDSLGLSYRAAEADADVIAFCGVHFMGETAKIVNPGKTVVIPDLDAGCSLSDSCPRKTLRLPPGTLDKNYYVVAYINCSAGVKALSDVICTSGNAVRIVESVPADRNILFVPDQNLGAWVTEQTGRPMTLWEGNCYVHVEFTRQSIERIRAEHPGAPVVAHPECTHAVRLLADIVCSTEKMVGYCRDSNPDAFIILTQSGMLHRLRRELPGKTFIPGPTDHCACADCRYMKMNTSKSSATASRTFRRRSSSPKTSARAPKPDPPHARTQPELSTAARSDEQTARIHRCGMAQWIAAQRVFSSPPRRFRPKTTSTSHPRAVTLSASRAHGGRLPGLHRQRRGNRRPPARERPDRHHVLRF